MPPQSCSTFAEDRAKLVKSKKLGPLMKNYKGNIVAILECGKCTAFFIDKNDFEKHVSSHSDAEMDNYESSNVTILESPKLKSRKPKLTFERKTNYRWRSKNHQKLRIKIAGNVVIKKTNKKVGKSKNDKCVNENLDAQLLQRRRSTRINYEEYNDSDVEMLEVLPQKSKKNVSTEENCGDECKVQSHIPKRKREPKNKFLNQNVMAEINKSVNENESYNSKSKSKKLFKHHDTSETSVEKSYKKLKLNDDIRRTESFVKKRNPRLKRLRRNIDDEEDRSQTIYTCAHCLRNFRRKSNLKRHMSKLHCSKEKDEAADSSKWFTGYCCDICGEGLQVRSTMMSHRDVIHGKYPEIDWCKYQTSLARVKFCPECKKYFRSGKLFDEHKCDKGAGIIDEEKTKLMREVEEERPTFYCSICNLSFRWKWDYRLHRESEHKDAKPIEWTSVTASYLEFFCDRCSKAYNTEQELKLHSCTAAAQQSSNDVIVKPFRCDICGNDYFWKSDFRRHMRTKHPKENYRPTEHDTIVYSCPYCDEKFSMKKRILHHMRKAHNITSDSPFVCVQCNKVFRRRDNLDRHNESYHPALNDTEEANNILKTAEIRINGEIAYHCQMCNRNIVNPNRFISHYRGHYSESKFTCDLCGKQAKTQHQLNTHIKNIHLNIRNYKCDICDKSFYTKQACEEHRRIHTGERPFSCEICGKTFVAGNALISHKRFHNDFYPHSCHMCPKKFKVRRSLINHIRTHTGERPFKCDLCTKTFNNSSQYSYHKKVTHSEARPFTCSLCGNCFKANKFLSRHMELHAVRSQIQSRKLNNPTHYVVSDIKTSLETTTIVSTQHRVSHIEQVQTIPSPLLQTIQPVTNSEPNFIKQVAPSYRNDDITAALYSLQRSYEPNSNEFVRTNDCDINAMNNVKQTFSAAEAYMAAANYALAPNEDYKPTVTTRSYNTSQSSGNQNLVTGKHMTWL
ncbi:hypothetical protein PGB90_004743 [Kerria lacca]